MAFSDNIWWTRKAKIHAEKRILSNAFQAQILLLWYSFFGVAVSIYYLKTSSQEDNVSGIAWVIYSVLVLCISGFINGLSFKERAGLIKECYETLNNIYRRVKHYESLNSPDLSTEKFSEEYEQILGVCENHLTIDYYSALCESYLTTESKELNRVPTKYIWLYVAWYKIKRLLIMILFYLLPVAIFLQLRCID
ncbi:SLATT domain-containing protein [Cellvibrio sp. NN19]|uniref:SLATT domain-containing protein n=1 Tax=Cellvibrio chitinivorans TaxID=3102792 RepID=UPI002B40472E|nr:SLATT domain-containing protein [Cellvibrio sp. NN19]